MTSTDTENTETAVAPWDEHVGTPYKVNSVFTHI